MTTYLREWIFFSLAAIAYILINFFWIFVADNRLPNTALFLFDAMLAVVYLFFLQRHNTGFAFSGRKFRTVYKQSATPSSHYKIWAAEILSILIGGGVMCGLTLLMKYNSDHALVWEPALEQVASWIGLFILFHWCMRIRALGKMQSETGEEQRFNIESEKRR